MVYRVVYKDDPEYKIIVDSLLKDGYIKDYTDAKATWFEVYSKQEVI